MIQAGLIRKLTELVHTQEDAQRMLCYVKTLKNAGSRSATLIHVTFDLPGVVQTSASLPPKEAEAGKKGIHVLCLKLHSVYYRNFSLWNKTQVVTQILSDDDARMRILNFEAEAVCAKTSHILFIRDGIIK